MPEIKTPFEQLNLNQYKYPLKVNNTLLLPQNLLNNVFAHGQGETLKTLPAGHHTFRSFPSSLHELFLESQTFTINLQTIQVVNLSFHTNSTLQNHQLSSPSLYHE